MNGYQRIAAALRGEPTDKIPVMLHNFMMAAREFGVTMESFRNDPETIAGAFVSSVEKYRFDGIVVDVDTATLAGAVGVPVDFPVDAPARAYRGCLGSLEEVRDLDPADLAAYGPIQIWLEAVGLIKDQVKDEIFVRGNCDQAPFSLASMMRGIENWMMDLATGDVALVLRLLEYCAEATTQFVRLMGETGCDMVSNGDSPAGPELVSPRIYEKFALPFETAVVSRAHARGLPYALHICGNTGPILEPMLRTGADAFELDHKTDPARILDTFRGRATFIGNIDPKGVLAFGTPAEVERATGKLLEVFGDSDRFILNAGCAIPAETAPENLKAMIAAARSFR
jgi:MtaA/CmuA family methyltransferase